MNYFKKTTRILTFAVGGRDSLYIAIVQDLINYGEIVTWKMPQEDISDAPLQNGPFLDISNHSADIHQPLHTFTTTPIIPRDT